MIVQILLSLFWKRFNFKGAVAGILSGAVTDIIWAIFLFKTEIYELIPGFAMSLFVAILVTLSTKEPSKEVKKLFDEALTYDK